MRALTMLPLCGFVMVVGGWTQGTTKPVPPKCPAGLNTAFVPRTVSIWTPRVPGSKPGSRTRLYQRFCGPAQALVHLRGVTFRLRGGYCERALAIPAFYVAIGMNGVGSSEYIGLSVHHPADHPGTSKLGEAPLVLASFLLRGTLDIRASEGTITIGRSMQDGTFALRLDDGTPVTGSWTCGRVT